MDVPNEKEEVKRMQGVRKPRKDEEVVWAPPRNKSDWFWRARRLEVRKGK